MKNIIIVLWIILTGFFIMPIAESFMSGVSESEVMTVIQRESEADDIEITAEEIHGDKAMYCFKTKNDFGVAVFTHYADNYSYSEGTIANGDKYIKVRLDTGWDVYQYNVMKDGAELINIEHSAGNYRIYAVIGAVLLVITAVYIIYRTVFEKKKVKQI